MSQHRMMLAVGICVATIVLPMRQVTKDGVVAPDGSINKVASFWTVNYTASPEWSKQFFHGPITYEFSFDLAASKFAVRQYIKYSTNNYTTTYEFLSSLYTPYGEGGNFSFLYTVSGLCFPQPRTYSSVLYAFGFGWLADATKKASKVVGGKICDVMVLDHPHEYSWSACMTPDGIPLEIDIVVDPDEVGSTIAKFFSFTNLTLENIGSVANVVNVDMPSACRDFPPPACDDTGAKPLELVRVCSYCGKTPANSDGSDFDGELNYLCGLVGGHGIIQGASHVAKYEMMVNSSFGPYQTCNYSPNKGKSLCSKGRANLVGRSVPQEACTAFPNLPNCGQCTTDPVGYQYSFPESGACGAGEPVGTNQCTWSVLSAKQVNVSCLAPRLKASCAVYMHRAMDYAHPDPAKLEAAKADVHKQLMAAFDSDGGCPVAEPER